MGRLRTKIDWKRVDELLRAHCSLSSIARVFNIHYDTLYAAIEREFKMHPSEYSMERKKEGTALMREAIYRAGINGNIIAQIFWLKNRDGWSDKTLMQHEILPPVQLTLPPDVSQEDVKMVEAFFNSVQDDNKRISEEPKSLPERGEADN